MCADTEGKESLDEVVKRKTNSLVSLFKMPSRPNIHSHKTPENITTSFARCRPLNGKKHTCLAAQWPALEQVSALCSRVVFVMLHCKGNVLIQQFYTTLGTSSLVQPDIYTHA